VSELEFNVPFQHKHGYIRDERSEVAAAQNGEMYGKSRHAGAILGSSVAALAERGMEIAVN